MMKESIFRVALVSDLHAFDGTLENASDPNPFPSSLDTRAIRSPRHHPIDALVALIQKKNPAFDDHPLTADLLLCPGDLGDKARAGCIEFAWEELNKIGTALNVKRTLVTVGNHDVDSRMKGSSPDPMGVLKERLPVIPAEESLRTKFWADNFCVVIESKVRVVIVNSSAFHGTPSPQEMQKGRVTPETLAKLRKVLSSDSGCFDLNILLCHHHPIKHTDLDEGAYDEIDGGDDLMDLLDRESKHTWLVVHGHKHHPKIRYASGTSKSPVVFSAGSLCARLHTKLRERASNQFYLLEFDLNSQQKLGVVGKFYSWDWHEGHGWLPAAGQIGLPRVGGFGYRRHPWDLAHEIADRFQSSTTYLRYDELVKGVPALNYLVPDDLAKVFEALESHDYLCEFDEDSGLPSQLLRV